MANDDRPASPTASTVVGSVAGSGYHMNEPYHDAAEETSLLGAGAAETDVDGLARQRTDSWIAWEDFNDIPRWRRPSVSATREP